MKYYQVTLVEVRRIVVQVPANSAAEAKFNYHNGNLTDVQVLESDVMDVKETYHG